MKDDRLPPVSLAPEMAETIAKAQAALERSIIEGKLRDDPLRHPLAALSTMLDALHRLFVDSALTLSQTIKQPIDSAAVVDRIGKEVGQAMRTQAPVHVAHAVKEHGRRWALQLFGGALFLLVVGYGFGYWHRAISDRFTACYGGEVMTDKASGRRFCIKTSSVWLDPVPQTAAKP